MGDHTSPGLYNYSVVYTDKRCVNHVEPAIVLAFIKVMEQTMHSDLL